MNLPVCDVCNRPVENLSVEVDGLGERLVVSCHGETESVTISLNDRRAQYSGALLSFGRAFVTRRLDANPG